MLYEVITLPFWLDPSQPACATVVLVHGFSATPREMRPLAEALTARGFAALGVRLPGHGTTPEDLARRNYGEWIATIDAAQRQHLLYRHGLAGHAFHDDAGAKGSVINID